MKIFSYLVLLCGVFFSLSADVVDEATGQSFPDQVSFSYNGTSYDLDATGVSTRKKLMFKVYSVASYLQPGNGSGDKFERIMDSATAKQLTMKWVRDVNAAKVQSGFRDSLKKNGAPKSETDTFVNLFTADASDGDEYVLRWIPGGTIEVFINGTKAGSIDNEEFARSLWLVWFGNKSVVKRDQLVSLL